MNLDEIALSRYESFRARQQLAHSYIRGSEIPGFREKYLAIRDRESLLLYEELKIGNHNSVEAKIFDRPRKKKIKPNRRLRIWVNLLIIAMVLAVVFFSVITPRLTPTHGDAVEDLHSGHQKPESLP